MFAVIWIPNFALQALLRVAPELRAEEPLALIPERTPRATIVQCTAAAAAAGVHPGLTPSQAQARCGELQVCLRSPSAEQNARAALLDAAASFSPYVEDTAEGRCTLEWKGQRRAPVAEIAPALLGRLASLGLPARVGFAPQPDLAWLAAQGTTEEAPWRQVAAAAELHHLPLESLAPPSAMLEILHRWGIRTLGPLVALGREPLAERLGPEALALLAQATGQTSRLLHCQPPVLEYREALELEHELETLEPLLFILRRFLEQLAVRLSLAYRVAAEITLTLGFTHGADYQRAFRLPAPTAEIEVLFRMLHTHLEQFTAEYPIVRMELAATPCRPPRQQFDLFESALRDPNQFAETLTRLVALLGNEQVGLPFCEPTHRPDAVSVRPVDFAAGGPAPSLALGERPARTISVFGLSLRRFRPPVPAQVLFHEQPCTLRSTILSGEVRAAQGPFPSSGEWWDLTTHWQRQEWDVELDDGTLCRLRQALENQWHVEGVYD